MEEGTKTKKTVFVGGISDDTDETALYEGFSTFGAHIPFSFGVNVNHYWTLVTWALQATFWRSKSPHQHRSTKILHRTVRGSPSLPLPSTRGLKLPFVQKTPTAPKHRGFAFITFSSPGDAQDAIDNMDLNELKGRVLRVNLARPMKAATLNPQGNRASAFPSVLFVVHIDWIADGCLFFFFLPTLQFGNQRSGYRNMWSRWRNREVRSMLN